MPSTQRTQIGVPRNPDHTIVGPTLTTSVAGGSAGGSNSLYRVADRKTPVMADGSVHGLIANLHHRGGNFDGSLNT